MIQFTIDTEIERPIGEVFAFVTDPAKLPSWQTNTIAAEPEEDGPLEIGSRLKEIHRGPGGKELQSLVEVSEYETDRVFALRMVEGALPVHARIVFETTDTGTRVLFTVQGQPTGAMRLAQPLLRVALKRQFKAHCSKLKAVLERRSP